MITHKYDLKPKLSYLALIDSMKQRGITFEITSENEAEAFMESNNYYFKLAAFRKNFPKNNGKYINLDFAYLQDLAAIDACIRRYLSDMSLAVEHGLKVKILDLITKNTNEDGYAIVQEFRRKNPRSYGRVLSYLRSNRYSHDLYKKHHVEPAV
jgi:abortive infection bacteriophage resistance protein